MRAPLRVALLSSVVALAAPAAANVISDFEGGMAGKARGASEAPSFATCTADDLVSPDDLPGSARIASGSPALKPRDGRMLVLSTTPHDESVDELARTRWSMSFHAATTSQLDLSLAVVTTDEPSYGDWFAILLDGRVIACEESSSLDFTVQDATQPERRGTGWMALSELTVDRRVDPGTHLLEVIVADGTDSTGETQLFLDDITLAIAGGDDNPCDSGNNDDCRPYPPEDSGEIPFDPNGPFRNWIFDDNRFCAAGPQLACSRIEPDGTLINPNEDGFVDATDCFFEMYVVADCGSGLHIPLFDVESGCIEVFDSARVPLPILVANDSGFVQAGFQICWEAEFCDGQGMNLPGGPGNEETMDVLLARNPLCGVFIVRFTSWAGCIWDLFANCSGEATEEFFIYDDLCEAEEAANPLPEVAIKNVQLTPGPECTVDYCVTVENSGCIEATPHELVVANDVETDGIAIVGLGSGDTQVHCGTLEVGGAGSMSFTQVTATIDPDDVLLECSESTEASACNPPDGGLPVTETAIVDCADPPICDAGGPYEEPCMPGGGPVVVALDGSGSSDPAGDPLTFAWTTDCPGGVIADPSAEQTTLEIDGGACLTCTVTLSVSDPLDSTATCEASVAVVDDTPPVVTPPPNQTNECGDDADIDDWFALASVTDNCGDPALNQPALVGFVNLCGDSFRQVWAFTANDGCGNFSTLTATWEFIDMTPPALMDVPGDVTVECGPIPAAGTPTAADGCGTVSVALTSEVTVDGSCPQEFDVIRTWTATDECGNTATASQTISVRDTLPPTLAGVPANTSADCANIPAPATPTAADSCGTATVSLSEETVPGPCPQSFTLVRTWTATDTCGNTTAASQSISVSDGTPPTLSDVPADQSASCNGIPSPIAPTATDDCGETTVTLDEQTLPGPCPDTFTLVRTWTASDECGNTATASQVIEVEDSQPPLLFGLPGDATVECNAIPDPPQPIALDNCSTPTIDVDETTTPGDCPGSFTLVRTWTATDACGNTTTGSQVLTVEDTTPPFFLGAPSDVTVDCSAVPDPPQPLAIDTCGTATLELNETTLATDCPPSILRTWTASDECGNTATTTQLVTLVDMTPPSFTDFPADVTVPCTDVPAAQAPAAEDDCSDTVNVVLTETTEPGTCAGQFTLLRTWTATDECGNSQAQTQQVEVVDTTPPELAGVPADASVECDAVPAAAAVTGVDDCGGIVTVSLAEQTMAGSCPQESTIVRTWTATDECGNTAVASQTLSVVDTTPPQLAGVPDDVTSECPDVPAAPVVTASDACDPAPTVVLDESEMTGDCAGALEVVRTWTATDACGNTATAQQVVSVVDTTPPTPTALLSPAEPLPPSSAGMTCNAPSSRSFIVACGATDACDPEPALSAVLRVTLLEVSDTSECATRVDDVAVDCGQLVELRLLAAPCPADGPTSQREPSQVGEEGTLIVTGHQVVLAVNATDDCGNSAEATFDPTVEPSTLCDQVLEDGTCCPALAPREGRDCEAPCATEEGARTPFIPVRAVLRR